MAEIDPAATPWAALVAAQQCLGLSDEGFEGAIYDIQSVRRFVGIECGRSDRLAYRNAPKQRKAFKKNPLRRVREKLEQAKASVCAKVKYCFQVVKCLLKHRKTTPKGEYA